MTPLMNRLFASLALTLLIGAGAQRASAQAAAPAPVTPPVTTVMATLKVAPGVSRDAIAQVMPSEVRDTVQLYLDGRITQWYSRADGTGVVFMIDASSVEAARDITDRLPLVKAGLASFDFVALTPLNPLRALIAGPAPSK